MTVHREQVFDPDRFAGSWRIVASTFPMWTRGRRAEPRFRYTPLSPSEEGSLRLADEVSYTRDGRQKRMKGIDTRLDRPGVVFRWRGLGMLRPLSSEWSVTAWNHDYTWAVITFSRSLLTPAGVDVVARERAWQDDSAIADEVAALAQRYGATPLQAAAG